jgi:dystroglycan 1
MLARLLFELQGNNIVLRHYHRGRIPANSPQNILIPMYERAWVRLDGRPADRDQLMMALADLNAVLIKASYASNMQTTS